MAIFVPATIVYDQPCQVNLDVVLGMVWVNAGCPKESRDPVLNPHPMIKGFLSVDAILRVKERPETLLERAGER